jgi:hypothetical protein
VQTLLEKAHKPVISNPGQKSPDNLDVAVGVYDHIGNLELFTFMSYLLNWALALL